MADRVLDDRGCLEEPPKRAADEEDRLREDRDYYCFSGGVGGFASGEVQVEEAIPRARGAGGVTARRSPAPISASFSPDLDYVASGWSSGSPVSRTRLNYASCFLPGTRILTPTGERNIEDLRIGDLVTTASGHRPIKFVPKQTFRRTEGETWPKGVAPIRIEAGALGGGMPHRPLFVSPFHAFYQDGRLVEAGQLVNGSTIVQVDHAGDIIEYLNIELEDHDLIRANGVLVETYRPSHILDRERFDNFVEYVDLYPGAEYQSFPTYAPYDGDHPVRTWWQLFARSSGSEGRLSARL